MIKRFLFLFILVLFSGFSSAYVVLYPGVEFYNDDLTIGFSNSDGVNVSYIEVGDGYVNLGDINLSMSFSGDLEVNVSDADSGVNLAVDTTVLRFNATHSSGSVTFTFTGNHSNAIYSLYRDSVFVSQHEASSFSWTQSSWSTHDFEIELDSYRPDCPTSNTSSYDVNSQTVNISWNNADYADYYVVMRRNDTYPTSRSDSSAYQVQNDTILYYNTTLTSTAYFSVWSYNSTTNTYSLNSCKLDAEWGAISIYAVYNESNPTEEISPFGLLISSSDGSTNYFDSHVNSSETPLYISKDDIPFGDDTSITINASGYKTTTYYFDYVVNNFYNHTLYMTPFYTHTPGEGDDPTSDDDTEINYTATRQYSFGVYDQDFAPLSDVKVNIKFYNNVTNRWENKSILLTDSAGEAQVDLVPNKNYKVFLTKEGYIQVGSKDWRPEVYSVYDPPAIKVFQMEPDYEDSETYEFEMVISFNGSLFFNDTLKVNYVDSLSNTTNAQFFVYEVYNKSETYISDSSTSSDSYSFWVSGINISRHYRVYIHLNHTNLGYVENDRLIAPLHDESVEDTIEDKFTSVIGEDEDINMIHMAFVFLPFLALLVIFRKNHAELGIISGGLYIGFSSIFFDLPDQLVYLAPFIVAIGFIYAAVKGGFIKL